MIIDKDGNEYIEHFGRIGMKWGVRSRTINNNARETANKAGLQTIKDKSLAIGKKIIGPSKTERDAGKKRHENRITKVNKGFAKLDSAKTKQQRNAAKAILHKVGNEKLAMADSKMAYTTSRGTRLVAFWMGPGAALGAVKVADYTRRYADRKYINSAKMA